jgi:hypothetical protein
MMKLRMPGFRPVAIGVALAISATALSACGGGGANNTAAAPITTVHFVNSMANAKAPDLAAHFVDFSFDYPSNWTVAPETGTPTAKNFVKIERDNADGITIENFAVGQFNATSDDPDQISALLPQLLGSFEGQVSTMPGYKRLSIGEATTVNGIAGQQLTFSATPKIGDKTGNMFGRIIILPQPGTAKGVVLVMLGTDVSGELTGIGDLGVKGDLPKILGSFKFAAAAPADANAAPAAPADANSAQ